MTKQADQSVDVIFAAQAFHWFNWDVCRTEWKRILKPGGYVFLVWNAREWKDYEDLLFDLCPGKIKKIKNKNQIKPSTTNKHGQNFENTIIKQLLPTKF